MNGVDMIFPQRRRLPRTTPKTPSEPLPEAAPTPKLDIEQWWRDHGLEGDPLPPRSAQEPIDWLARDSWEFYLLCVFMILWVWYWRWGISL